jgi:Domain of unknown function (DUF4062)/Protein kinase domain
MLDPVGTLRIFISATYSDLKEHRQATHDAIRGLDLHADDMVFWSSDDRDGATHSVERVRQSDILILLLAHRYGYVPAGEEYSVTELEYRAAREAKIPVLAFFLDETVAWPPDQVEWDARDKLRDFKRTVESEVTRKVFRTPEELATQVTQALALWLARRRETPATTRFAGQVREVSTAARLRTDPDVLVQIGTSEDGLPLLLDVRRGRDLSEPFRQLSEAVSSPGRQPPDAMLETFRQSLEQFAMAGWAADGLVPVRLRTGQDRELYVSRFNLAQPFTSVLAALLGVPMSTALRRERPRGRKLRELREISEIHTVRSGRRAKDSATNAPELESVGGKNRFLGVSPDDGATYSVGRASNVRRTVEWRPFICEDVLGMFPDATLSVSVSFGPEMIDGLVRDAPTFLAERLRRERNDNQGIFDAQSWVAASRRAVLAAVAAVARQLASTHAEGRVHADVKPHNVLVVPAGVTLIDSFNVPVGDVSPGWTPEWSAPEQVLGQPLTTAADVYPLALMVSRVLGGQLVGEVRKYRTPQVPSGPTEFDVFHDPLLYVDDEFAATTPAGVREWRRFAERALSFDPARRPASAAEFEAELTELAKRYPLAGTLHFQPSGQLMAARLPDGTDAVARVIADHRVDAPPPPRHAAASQLYELPAANHAAAVWPRRVIEDLG